MRIFHSLVVYIKTSVLKEWSIFHSIEQLFVGCNFSVTEMSFERRVKMFCCCSLLTINFKSNLPLNNIFAKYFSFISPLSIYFLIVFSVSYRHNILFFVSFFITFDIILVVSIFCQTYGIL